MAERQSAVATQEYRPMATARLALNDILQFIHAYEVDAQTCINVFHYKVKAADTVGTESYFEQLAAILTTLSDSPASLVASWKAMATADCTTLYSQIQRIAPTRNLYVRQTTGGVGDLAGVSAPSICALSISRRTEDVGRGKTGHVQISGCPAADLVHGEWDAATLGRADDFAVVMLSTVVYGAGGELEPVLYGETRIPSSSPIVAATVHTTVRTMHRRTVGLGI